MKKIYLLPNLITTGNFFCGVLSMMFTVQGRYMHAGWFILLGMGFDFLDGYIARISRATSRFGVEYDSLADLTTFGLAPSLLVYRIFLVGLGRLGIGAAFLFSVSAALRLARYNIQHHGAEKDSFTGLPTPGAAGLIVSVVLIIVKYVDGENWSQWTILLPVLMTISSYLMLSTIPFAAAVRFETHNRKPFVYLAVTVLSAVAFIFHAEICVFLLFAGYAVVNLFNALSHRNRVLSMEMTEVDKDETSGE